MQSSTPIPTTESLFKAPSRSRKRTVSNGGSHSNSHFGSGSDRLIFSNSSLKNLCERERKFHSDFSDKFKSLSLSFNFNPPNPEESISFTSGSSTGKWGKFKRLVKSVRPKRKSKYPPKPSGSDLTQDSLLEQSSFDLKKRRFDDSNLSVVLGSVDKKKKKRFRDQSLQTQVEMTDMEAFYKPTIAEEGAGRSEGKKNGKTTNGDAGAQESPESVMGIVPGGECRQPCDPEKVGLGLGLGNESINCPTNNFRTPRQSLSEINTESDASFVICDAVDESDIGDLATHERKEKCGFNLNQKIKKKKSISKLPKVTEETTADETDSGAGASFKLTTKKARDELDSNTTNTTSSTSDGPKAESSCDLDRDLETEASEAELNRQKVASTRTTRAKPPRQSKKGSASSTLDEDEAEKELIKTAIGGQGQGLDDSDLDAKVDSLLAEGINSQDFGDLILNPPPRPGFRIPPFLLATIVALILQYAVVPFFKRLFSSE